MQELTVKVLGGLGLQLDGVPVPISGNRRNLIVALLAANAGALVAASKLIDVLDPDARRSNAGNALQAHIRRIRAGIEPGVSARNATKLRTVGDGYQLMPDSLDLWEYRHLVRAARSSSTADPVRSVALFGEALALWGEPLGAIGLHPALADFSHFLEVDHLEVEDEWIVTCLRLPLRADDQVGSASLGLSTTLVDDVVRAAEAQPTRESRTVMAMQLLYRIGRQTEALRLYEATRVHLRDELGLDPGPELRAMNERVLLQDPSLLEIPDADRSAAGVSGRTKPAPQRRLSMAMPHFETGFVGRKRLRDTLSELSNRSGVVTVTGMPGVGKTRLVAEWVSQVSDLDPVMWLPVTSEENSVVRALCHEVGLGLGPDVHEARSAAIELLPRTGGVLVVDGAEAAMDEVVRLIVDVRARRPDLFILVTSQEPLGLVGEQVVPVSPFGVPVSGDPLEGDAVELLRQAFERSGRRVEHDELVDLARRCGGLPLALELVASGVEEVGTATIGTEPGRPAAVLAEAVETVRMRVSPAAREMLDLCSLLPAGVATATVQWWRDTARPRDVDDPWEYRRLLNELVDSTLVWIPAGTQSNRHHAINQVSDCISSSMGQRRRDGVMGLYLNWLTALLLGQAPHELTTVPPGVDDLAAPHRLLDRGTHVLLEEEGGNLDVALGYALDRSPEQALDLLTLLITYFRNVAGRVQGQNWAERILGLEGLSPESVARATQIKGLMRPDLAAVAAMHDDLVENLERLEMLGWTDGEGWIVANLLVGIAKGWRRDLAGAREALARADAVAVGPWQEALIDRYRSLLLFAEGNFDGAVNLLDQTARRLEECGDELEALGALFFILTLSRAAGLTVSEEILQRSLRLATERRQFHTSLVLAEHAALARDGDSEATLELLAEAALRLEEDGNLRSAARTRRDLGLRLVERGRHRDARVHLSRASEMLLVVDVASAPLALAGLAVCARATEGESSPLAVALEDLALELIPGQGTPLTPAEIEALLGIMDDSRDRRAALRERVCGAQAEAVEPVDIDGSIERARTLLGDLARP